jgi:hypothetical protein
VSRRFLAVLALGLAGCDVAPPAPTLDAVTPAAVGSDQAEVVWLLGQHLEPRVTLDFDAPERSTLDARFSAALAGPAAVALEQVTWHDAGVVSAVVPALTPPGLYGVSLVDPFGRSASREAALTVRPPCPVTYLDLDGDGVGDSATAERSCAPGRADAGGDCNDQDPLTHPGATEVCNGLDDDCDGQVDEGACASVAPSWRLRPDAGPGAPDWATAASPAPGVLWAAGGAQVGATTDGGALRSLSVGCPAGLTASWAAADRWVQVGGGASGSGRLGADAPDRAGCFDLRSASDLVVGLVGFGLPDGGALLRGVTRRGVLVSWSRGGAPVEQGTPSSSLRLEDLHGAGLDSLYAVGSSAEDGTRMRAYRWLDGGWQEERVSAAASLGQGSLHGVWVLGPESVFAVGDDGTAVEKRGGSWRRLPGLDGGSLRAVRAFGVGRVYVVSAEGLVLRWDGRGWTVLADHRGRAAYQDLAGSAEDDLWGVGAGGAVVHWPQ